MARTEQQPARLIVFDVETYRTRNESVIAMVREEQASRRCAKNAAKLVQARWHTEEAIEERTADAVADSAKDVLLAEILCVCWEADGDGWQADMMRLGEEDALALLAQSWETAAGPDTIWCGHNVAGFDLAVLLNGWRRHGIAPPSHFPVFANGRWRGRVYDTMQRTPCKNGLGYVGLDLVCAAYGLGRAKQAVLWDGAPMDGSRVGAAYEAGEYDLILKYCSDDVAVQRELYLRQTANDAWGTFDRHSDLAEQVAEIQDSADLSEGAKAIAIVKLLEGAGLMPRRAAA